MTALGGLFTAAVLLARRELDRGREQVADLDRRLRTLEADHVFLKPLVRQLQHNVEVQGRRIASQVTDASAD